jgi:CBS domain-containing protein
MNVAKLCRYQAVTVRKYEDLIAAAELMRRHHVGYLIVVEPELGTDSVMPIGVLTDRDIVISVVARATDPRTLTVGDVMTQQPVVAAEDESLDSALESMRRIGVRRLPVVGARRQLVGVLSLDDILDMLAAELSNVAGSIRNEQRIESALRRA